MEPFAKDKEQLLRENSVDIQLGLSSKEAQSRLIKYGENKIKKGKPFSLIRIIFNQFKSPIVIILLIATVISYLFGDITESIAILAVIVINGIIGFILEFQAHRSMEALFKIDKHYAKVVRDGQLKNLEVSQIVPGDIVFVEAGDLISADGRLVDVTQLEVNESLLTGESLPIPKQTDIVPKDSVLGDQTNMVFKGTSVTKGNARILITATGMATEVGKISDMVEEAQKDEIPINEKLNKFSKKLISLTLVIISVFIGVGYFTGDDLYLITETAIALAVAAIPEGLPIVATIALAKGMLKMTKSNVLVRKLSAVETLGETDLIMTDKTGTLTENRLQVSTVILNLEEKETENQLNEITKTEGLNKIVRVAILCNNAKLNEEQDVGDPLEVALLRFSKENYPDLFNTHIKAKRLNEKPFDSESRIMTTIHEIDNKPFLSMKGGPSEVLAKCSEYFTDKGSQNLDDKIKKQWLNKVDELAREGLKVLGFAHAQHNKIDSVNNTFIGLIGFLDPPRKDVPDAIHQCYQAGIRVIMVTGDHSETAKAIADQIGLMSDQDQPVVHGSELSEPLLFKGNLDHVMIFSRVNPAQKLMLMKYYQQRGDTVAMTGDGVNDAPALKKSDIGIAMGLRGTEVAREAADMVLQNDSFSSLVQAIKQGRIIFKNIKNFVIYLLSCNLSEILVVGIAVFSKLSLPLLPLQILFLNLITDVFPALALGMSGGGATIMEGKFEGARGPLLGRKNWKAIIAYAFILSFSVLGAYIWAIINYENDPYIANNIAFYALAFAQLLHPLSLIKADDKFFNNEIIKNPHLWGAILFCSIIMVGIYFLPIISEVLDIHSFASEHLLAITLASLLPVIIIRIAKKLKLVV